MPLPNRYMQLPPGPDPDAVPNLANMIVEIPTGRRSQVEVEPKPGLSNPHR